MKTVALIILISIYSTAVVGFSLREFYCCGKLKSVSVTFSQDAKQKCSKGNGSGCCGNKYQFFKVKDNHFASDDVNIPVKHFTDLNLFTPSSSKIMYTKLIPNIDVPLMFLTFAMPCRLLTKG